MTIFIETKRLIIKKPTLQDLSDLYSLQSDPEVMKYVGKGVRTKAEVKIGLLKAIEHDEKHGFSLGSVYEKNSGHFIGRAGLIYLAFDDSQSDIEFGYALHKMFWNYGYAVELSIAMIKWAFTHLDIPKLVAVTHPDNQRSRRVLEKVNMHYVGRDRYNNIEVCRYELEKHI